MLSSYGWLCLKAISSSAEPGDAERLFWDTARKMERLAEWEENPRPLLTIWRETATIAGVRVTYICVCTEYQKEGIHPL